MQAAKRHEQPISTRGQQRTSKDHGFAHRWRGPDQESEASAKAYRTGQELAFLAEFASSPLVSVKDPAFTSPIPTLAVELDA